MRTQQTDQTSEESHWYELQCELFAVDPDGRVATLHAPHLMTVADRPITFFAGGETPIAADAERTIEFLRSGLSIRATVTERTDGRTRLDIVLEKHVIERQEEEQVVQQTRSVRFVGGITLDNTVTLDLPKESADSVQHRAGSP